MSADQKRPRRPKHCDGLVAALIGACLLFSSPVHATDLSDRIQVSGLLDFRAALASDEQSWLEHGLGKTRYGTNDAGADLRAALADVSLEVDVDLGGNVSAFGHIQNSPEQDVAIDLVEGFLTYKPLPRSARRYKVRAGLFFPPVSLEHVGPAWTSPYSITPSAINSWIGEEVKVAGLEASVSTRFDEHKLTATGSLFYANDPTGTLISWRGWAFHDVKLTANTHLPLAPISALLPSGPFGRRGQTQWVDPVREIDNRPGYYGKLSWQWRNRFHIDYMAFDNRGRPEVFDGEQYGWGTTFHNFGFKTQLPGDVELLAQYMEGRTVMGPNIRGKHPVDTRFDSHYLLLSKKIDALRLTVRYDEFETRDPDLLVSDNNNESGRALTAATSIDIGESHRVLLEVLRIDSRRPERADLGLMPRAVETQLQASYRLYF